MPDEHGYPTDEELEKIAKWPAYPVHEFHALMAFVYSLWTYGDWGWKREGKRYNISTGGWSGNEVLIGALEENQMFWALYWEQSRRGGHYLFSPMSTPLEEK